MSVCPTLAGDGVAAALGAVDCLTGQATAQAFGRLFGQDGRLLTALTVLLTLYVALFAVALLTGRTRLGLASLTPRMLTLGLVLTFATSWVAYRDVVWTLAARAPDEVATVVTGARGSATVEFANRLDRLFDAVQEAAQAASQPAASTGTSGVPTPAAPLVGGFSASTVLWISALMLLLGTVGVLVTTKIALAAMLALGPVFMVMALFRGTRGLFEGWAKAVVLFALVPLFAVLIGGGALLALDPVVRQIATDGAQPDTRATAVLFLGAAVYLALMVMAVKAATTLVAGWRIPGGRDRVSSVGVQSGSVASSTIAVPLAPAAGQSVVGARAADDRVRGIVAALPAPSASGPDPVRVPVMRPATATVIQADGAPVYLPRRDPRVAGLGSRFRTRPHALPKEPVA